MFRNRMMKLHFHKPARFAPILALPLFLLVSLSFSPSVASASPQDTTKSEAMKVAQERASEQGLDLKHDPGVAQDAALRLAEQHLALRNIRWGKPTDVREDGDLFVLSYDTPENETRLVGKRTVTVRKVDGLVKVRDRR